MSKTPLAAAVSPYPVVPATTDAAIALMTPGTKEAAANNFTQTTLYHYITVAGDGSVNGTLEFFNSQYNKDGNTQHTCNLTKESEANGQSFQGYGLEVEVQSGALEGLAADADEATVRAAHLMAARDHAYLEKVGGFVVELYNGEKLIVQDTGLMHFPPAFRPEVDNLPNRRAGGPYRLTTPSRWEKGRLLSGKLHWKNNNSIKVPSGKPFVIGMRLSGVEWN